MSAPPGWRELAPGVLVLRLEPFRLNVGLVLGREMALLVDTGPSLEDGRALVSRSLELAPLPLGALNTHAHFDHCLGNGALDPGHIWAHRRCAEHQRWDGEEDRREACVLVRAIDAALERRIAASPVVVPDCTLEDEAVLDLGGRLVTLTHPGRGHTDHDVVAWVHDSRVLFAGDLVEEGAPPSFEDSFPLEWPGALGELLTRDPLRIVPGHGADVDAAFVRRQMEELGRLADLCRSGLRQGRGSWELLREAPFPAEAARVAIRRAYSQMREQEGGTWMEG